MEVSILISSAFEAITSPSNLARAIGVPHGSKIRFRRDTSRYFVAATRMVVRCDKPTASHLRNRFNCQRPYVHEGLLTSLECVAMRPIAGCLPFGHSLSRNTPARAQMEGVDSSVSDPSQSARTAYSSHSASRGINAAIGVVESNENDALSAPGIAELYEQFLRSGGLMVPSFYPGGGERTTASTSRSSRRKRLGYFDEKKRGETKAEYSSSGGESKCSYLSSEIYSSTDSSTEQSCTGYGRIPRGRQSREFQEQGQLRTIKGSNKIWDLLAQREVTAHRNRWHKCHAFLSVADITSALVQISGRYSDAPKQTSLSGVISLLAKLYADGAAFASNRQKDMETLDRLGVMHWRARTQESYIYPQGSEAYFHVPKLNKAVQEWHRLLEHVKGVVKRIVDFGTFVQVYVAAVDKDRLVSSEVGGKVRLRPEGFRGCASTPPAEERDISSICRKSKHRRGEMSSSTSSDFSSKFNAGLKKGGGGGTTKIIGSGGQQTEDRETACMSIAMDCPRSSYHGNNKPLHSRQLEWLFPRKCEEDGERAFARHVMCGGPLYGLITVEAAVAIIRDAGKDISLRRVWRWCCEKSTSKNESGNSDGTGGATAVTPRAGHFLHFEDFVEMCQGLKNHIKNAAIMNPDDYLSGV